MEYRGYKYKKTWTSWNQYIITKYGTNDGFIYDEISVVPEDDEHYQLSFEQGVCIEEVAYEFPDLEGLKRRKIEELQAQTTEKIYNTRFEKSGHAKDGKTFSSFNQKNASLGVAGFDEEFREALVECIASELAVLDGMVEEIRGLSYEGLSDCDKQLVVERLGEIYH